MNIKNIWIIVGVSLVGFVLVTALFTLIGYLLWGGGSASEVEEDFPEAEAPDVPDEIPQEDLDKLFIIFPRDEPVDPAIVSERSALASQYAKDLGYIDVTGCDINPVVHKANFGEEVLFVNRDENVAVTITYNEVRYSIPTGSGATVDFGFSNAGTAGIYEYNCTAFGELTDSRGLIVLGEI